MENGTGSIKTRISHCGYRDHKYAHRNIFFSFSLSRRFPSVIGFKDSCLARNARAAETHVNKKNDSGVSYVKLNSASDYPATSIMVTGWVEDL